MIKLNPQSERWVWVIQNKKMEFLTPSGKFNKKIMHARIFTRVQDYPRALARWRKLLNDDTLYSTPCFLQLR